MAKKKTNTKPVEEVVENELETETEIEEVTEPVEVETPQPELKHGTAVIGVFAKLNVRKTPSVDAEVVGSLARSSEFLVDVKESTDDFCKVLLSSGVEGYCKKEFIEIVD